MQWNKRNSGQEKEVGVRWGVVGTCVTVLNRMLRKDLLEMKFEQTLEGGE